MKRAALVLGIFFLTAGLVWAKEYEVKKKVGEYEVEMRIDRNPPVVGNNQMTIKVEDGASKHITDAKVVVHYGMPAMPGMPPMNYKTDAALKEDKYGAKVNFSMAGPWNIDVKITRGGKTTSAKFNVDVK